MAGFAPDVVYQFIGSRHLLVTPEQYLMISLIKNKTGINYKEILYPMNVEVLSASNRFIVDNFAILDADLQFGVINSKYPYEKV
ncbi:MAG: hypothetical protein MZV70_44140 [Desulfobacterales bacterium]|nr:hypothetical protein [Desulfobacterales bacterium]